MSAPVGMKRELRVGDAAAFSVGLIGPVGVMALLGAGAAGILGRGAVWAFVFALVAVALVAYVLATAGALRFLFLGAQRAPAWQVVVPVLAMALVLYTIWRNAAGLDAPYSWFPYVVLAWLALGVAISLVPGLAGRVRASLERSQASAEAPEAAAAGDADRSEGNPTIAL